MVKRVCRICSLVSETEKQFCVECGTSFFDDGSQSTSGVSPVANSKATASLVIGVLGFVLFGLVLGAIAIVLSSMAKREMRQEPSRYNNKGAATVGLVLGIVDLIAGAFFVGAIF